MNNSVKMLVTLVLLMILSCSSASSQYTRSECIVKIKLNWKIDGSKKWSAMSEIMKAIVHSPRNGYTGPLPASAFGGEDKNILYLQFPAQCNEKGVLTKELIDLYVKPELKILPEYDITNEVVMPGPNTINVGGSSWKDGKLPEYKELENLSGSRDQTR